MHISFIEKASHALIQPEHNLFLAYIGLHWAPTWAHGLTCGGGPLSSILEFEGHLGGPSTKSKGVFPLK